MNKLVPEKIEYYKLNEAVGPEDLESDLYQGTKKLGKLGAAAAVGATAWGASKATGLAKAWIILPRKINNLSKQIEKDIAEWSKEYNGEFLKITDEAINRILSAKPKNMQNPQDIQTFNTNVKSIQKAYKNQYISFLNALHGMLKRDFAITTKRLLHSLKSEGFGSISNRAVRKLTNMWDKKLRELNKLAFEHVNEELNKCESLIQNKLGDQSPLLSVLHERPTAFFSSDDYTKISSFLQQSIENIKQSNTTNPQENNNNKNYEKNISFYENKYNQYSSEFNSGNFDENDLYEKIKNLYKKVNNLDVSKIPDDLTNRFNDLHNDIETLYSNFKQKYPNAGGSGNKTSPANMIISLKEQFKELDDKASMGSAASEDVLDEINELIKSIKKINVSSLSPQELQEYNTLVKEVKTLKSDVTEQVYTMIVINKLINIYKDLLTQGFKNNNINNSVIRNAASNFALEYIKDKTIHKNLFNMIKNEKLDATEFEQFIKKYK